MRSLGLATDILLAAQAGLAALLAVRLGLLRGYSGLLVAAAAVAAMSAASAVLHRRQRGVLRATLARNDALRVAAETDPLTGLGNRRAFDGAIGAAFARAAGERHGLSLIVIDIDHFKAFNDTFGHAEGDRVLRQTARAIGAVLDPASPAYRIGGEEMAVILPAVPLTDAARQAHRVVDAIAALRQPHPRGEGGRLTVSIGVAEGFPAAMPLLPETLVAAADRALYEAKHAGRARVRLASLAAGPVAPQAGSEERVDGLDIHLPNGSKLRIAAPLRLATVGALLAMVDAAPPRG